jgi:hypothetical protein
MAVQKVEARPLRPRLALDERRPDQTDFRRDIIPKITSAPPNSARALGSGMPGGPEAQLGVPGVQTLPGRVVSGPVPKSNETAVILVVAVMAASEIVKVPVPLIYGEK